MNTQHISALVVATLGLFATSAGAFADDAMAPRTACPAGPAAMAAGTPAGADAMASGNKMAPDDKMTPDDKMAGGAMAATDTMAAHAGTNNAMAAAGTMAAADCPPIKSE